MDEAKKNVEEQQLDDDKLEQANGGVGFNLPDDADVCIASCTVREELEW